MKSVTFTGVEFKRFWNDQEVWEHGDWYYDDDIILVNGQTLDCTEIPEGIKDTDIVQIIQGEMRYQGKDPARSHEFKDLKNVALGWKSKQTRTCLVIEIDKTDEERLRGYLHEGEFHTMKVSP
jgi:hypothetical protein